MEGDELGDPGTALSTIEELEPGVVGGVSPGTEVEGWAAGLEVVDGLGATVVGVEESLVMVKAGEVLSELPIRAMIYESPSGY